MYTINKMAGDPDRLYVSHHLSAYRTERSLHIHPVSYELMLFKSGNVDYFINDVTYHLEPGDLTLVCPNDLHGLFIKDETPYERIPVHIGQIYTEEFSTKNTDLFSCFHHSASNRVYHLSQAECKLYEEYALHILHSINQKEFGYDIRIKSYVSLLLLLANQVSRIHPSKNDDISPSIIKEAMNFITVHLTEELSVQAIANALNISRSRLSHLFRQFTGTTLWNYVTVRRVQFAQTLLNNGSSITDACYDCGFNDYAHFCKVFASVVGMPPGKYIKSQL
ncbi:helix-turn-helix domain-containing protein [Acetatifactor aquisgranensis]|uniref:helix-turn-helix domain-containing protein n=1 Tax=Acetatifactor aquisgranensis TaxID=2941233 RepID=UPI00203B34B4|nr:AraC family transcriptional regulator [Acetatifactor aquisgranensis]